MGVGQGVSISVVCEVGENEDKFEDDIKGHNEVEGEDKVQWVSMTAKFR